jgi:hypothetical protein
MADNNNEIDVEPDPSKILHHLLTLQNQMKLYHWQTKSYARHKAADEFVAKSINIIDRVVESYQGEHDTIMLEQNNKSIPLDNITDENIIAFLKKAKKMINTDFAQLLNAGDDQELANLRDEMLENIDITLYLFEFE